MALSHHSGSKTSNALPLPLSPTNNSAARASYSPECVQGKFCELRHGWSSRKVTHRSSLSGTNKAGAVTAAKEDEVSESIPASMLRSYPNAVLFLDEAVASDLGHGVAG